MALQRGVYRPRDAEHGVLHQVIAEHLEAFLRAVAEAGDGAGLPQFVEREFREFLTCGVFEQGVARIPVRGLRARALGAVLRSRGHPEDPRAPRPRPLGAESRPRPPESGAARWHSC